MNESQSPDLGNRFPRRRGIVLVAIGLLVAAVVSLLIPLPFTGRIAVSIGNLAHAPLFGSLTLVALSLLQQVRPLKNLPSLWVRCGIVALSLFTFGIAMEVLQKYSGRSAAWHDVMANGMGILAAACLFFAWQLPRMRPAVRWLPRALLTAAGVCLGIASWTPLAMLYDVAALHRDFPLLASFESSSELQRWYFRECQPQLTRQGATDGSYAMALAMQPTTYPAATMIEMETDWSAMKTLELDVTLDAAYPKASVEFIVKVVDAVHQSDDRDTFRSQWTLRPGQPQHIRITREEIVNGPDTRQLDLTKIQFVDLIVVDPKVTATLRIDALRLTLR